MSDFKGDVAFDISKEEKWSPEKAAAVFGTLESDWVPTDRDMIIEGISLCDLSEISTVTLINIYKLLGRNREPRDIVDRIHAGLPVE